jgi:hypothetical protein
LISIGARIRFVGAAAFGEAFVNVSPAAAATDNPHHGGTTMRDMERDSETPKKDTGDQVVTKAPKAPSGARSDVLETVRQKMAYTIRGI